MSAIVTDANARWLPGEPVSLAEIATLSNARRRDAQLLGLERVAKDITDLDSYLHPRSPVNDDLGACFAVQQATRVRPSFSHRPKDRSTPKDQVQQIAFRSCSEWSQLRVGKAEPAISIRRYSVPPRPIMDWDPPRSKDIVSNISHFPPKRRRLNDRTHQACIDPRSPSRTALACKALPGDSWRPWPILLIALMGEELSEVDARFISNSPADHTNPASYPPNSLPWRGVDRGRPAQSERPCGARFVV
ncbi:hypothetical protein [Rhizobium leguminosarum]|uniref:hypothetical protein n=1 Tax=Rhizobium leguminosarum TaxID=384 RepID=UPI001C90817E|nr:hypothetical protein [Rhizobium leguminosarum]